MLHSLLKPRQPSPANGPARQPAGTLARSAPIQVRLSTVDCILSTSSRPDVHTMGPATVTRGPSGILITEGSTASGPFPICHIEVPAGASVDAHNQSGSVTIHKFEGTLRVFTNTGNITARKVQGDIQLVSDRGAIKLEQINGPVAARSSTGGIEAIDLNGAARLSTRTGAIRITGDNRQLTVKSQTGDIALDASVVDHTTLETEKGRLEIHLGSATDARIDASARQGVVRTQRLALFGGSGRRVARATLGRGQARLALSTGMGVIEISGPLRAGSTS